MAAVPAPPPSAPPRNPRELKRAERLAHRDEERRDLDTARREEAMAIGADMEMGYYESVDGDQWEPRPLVVRELLRKMGYGNWFVKTNRRPRWWPGMDAFRRMVAWKVAIRRMQQQVDFSNRNAWAGPLVGLAVEEMGHRLATNPASVSDRDITDLITKLTRVFVEGRPAASAPPDQTATGARARFVRTTEVFEMVEEPRARAKLEADYRLAIAEAEKAIPARATPVEP